MHENIWSSLSASKEAEPPQPVEPFHLRSFESAGGRHSHMSPRRRHLCWMHRCGFIHGQNTKRLQTARALQYLDYDARAFVCDLEAVAPQARHVQENVWHAVVGNDESISFGYIEPLDDAGELNDARRLVTNVVPRGAANPQTAARPLRFNSVRRHDAPTPPASASRS